MKNDLEIRRKAVEKFNRINMIKKYIFKLSNISSLGVVFYSK